MLDVKTFYRSFSLRATQRCLRPAALLTSCSVLAILQACSSTPKPFQPDLFSTTASPYAHSFVATNAQACEAARRAMLSQGYTTTAATADAVDANKGFQPSTEVHVVVSFHVVCTPSESANGSSTLYVNAVQDNYGLKKSDTSATVGLSIIGSLSLPIRSNNDSMVKFSSQTIPPGAFYDRFFALVDHYLKTVVRSSPIGDDASVTESPLPTPAAVLSRSAPPIPVDVGGASAPGANVTPLAPAPAVPASAPSGSSGSSGSSAPAAPAAASAPSAASDATSQPTPAKHAGKSPPASVAGSTATTATPSAAAQTSPPPAANAQGATSPAAASGAAALPASSASESPKPAHATAAAAASAAASSPPAAGSPSAGQSDTASASSNAPASAAIAASAASAPTTP